MTATIEPAPAPPGERLPPPPDATSGAMERARWRPARAASLVRGRPGDPAWVRPALLALLAGTAVLYLWGLGASGWANSYYSAAVQAASKSWKAFFFGSSDAANAITVDKAPGALWVMDLSARLFGVNAWAILVPQALEGVAAVGLLYAAVRRWFTPGAGLLAGAVLALTPVSALMFRYDNPDALLVLLLVAAAYAMVRAVEGGSSRWLVAAGALVGFGFLAKMLQAFLLVPVFAVVYVVAGPPKLGRRVLQLGYAGIATIVAAGWWVAAVQLVPASARPYIGGSQDNSLWNLLFGYNGFGRLTGNEAGSVGGGGGPGGTGTGRWGTTGWSRLFGSEMGAQISWLIPAALILGAACLLVRRRAPRTDRARAALLLWGGWLVGTALVFSYGKGIIHPYYTVALAPAIGALVGIGVSCWWSRRHRPAARTVLASAMVATTSWSYVLLRRTPAWHPLLGQVVVVGGLVVGAVFVAAPHLRGRLAAAFGVAALVVALAGPGAYALATAATPHAGALPSAGPAGSVTGPGGFGGAPNGVGRSAGGGAGFGGGPGGGGGVGSLLSGSAPSRALVQALERGDGNATWIVATVGSNQASGYQLATGRPVLAIGGFNGTDPSPTLAQFRRWVAQGRIHWFVGGGVGQSSTSTATAITNWVASHAMATTVDGTTVYDLSPLAGS